MDDEGGMPSSFSNNLYTDTVRIYVESEWGSPTQTGIQLCPAVFVPNATQIPQAVKHIYRQANFGGEWMKEHFPQSFGCIRRWIGPRCSRIVIIFGWHREFIQFWGECRKYLLLLFVIA